MATKFNFSARVEAIKPLLKPPVANSMLFNNALKVMIVGGPNQRKDFHIEMGEELFYQIVGDMDLVIVNPKTECQEAVHIREGEIFLLPAGIPHSPQRYANTIGLVFERDRFPEEMDCLRWHADADPTVASEGISSESKASILYEEYFHCMDLGSEIKEAIGRFQNFLSLPATNRPKLDSSHLSIEALMNVMKAAKEIDYLPPFPLASYLQKSSDLNDSIIFDSEFILKQYRNFSDSGTIATHSFAFESAWKECFLWQFKGNAVIALENGEQNELNEGEVLFLTENLVNSKISIQSATRNDVTLFVANKFSKLHT